MRFTSTRIFLIVIGSVSLVLLGSVGALVWWHAEHPSSTGTSLQDSNRILRSVLHKSTTLVMAHLANADQPLPTNKWFSSLAFDQKNPVFAYPLSYALTAQGFSVSYAAPVVTQNTVSTPHTNDLSVSFGAPASTVVASYDDLSVSLLHKTGQGTVATSRITEGSPFIFISMVHGATATITSSAGMSSSEGNTIYFKIGSNTYGLTAATIPSVSGNHAEVGGNFALYILPHGANPDDYRNAAGSSITGTSVAYSRSGNQYMTSYTLTTDDARPTIWGTVAQQAIPAVTAYGTLASLDGTETFIRGNTFQASQQFTAPASSLDLSTLTSAQKTALSSQLEQDVAATTFTATDSYGAGKQLYRAANLLLLAEQLGQANQAAKLKAMLKTQLDMWFTPTTYRTQTNKYFYYDTSFRGMVGVNPSFGSDQFNDHHFHYGYLLYAAAVLSRYDASFMHDHQSMIDLVVQDIANPTQDSSFPRLRVFDEYFGHSWASGLSPFGDGNNQESSSEAVLAWNATYQWATVSKDTSLQALAGWLYTRETTAATNQWLTPATGPYPGYTHPFASLVWGGKFDYATWFSANPSAILAIQLIPMSPAHTYTLRSPSSIQANLATIDTQQPALFPDYLAMYEARIDPTKAANTINTLQASDFDSANSKTYALAWTYMQAARKP